MSKKRRSKHNHATQQASVILSTRLNTSQDASILEYMYTFPPRERSAAIRDLLSEAIQARMGGQVGIPRSLSVETRQLAAAFEAIDPLYEYALDRAEDAAHKAMFARRCRASWEAANAAESAFVALHPEAAAEIDALNREFEAVEIRRKQLSLDPKIKHNHPDLAKVNDESYYLSILLAYLRGDDVQDHLAGVRRAIMKRWPDGAPAWVVAPPAEVLTAPFDRNRAKGGRR